MPKQPRPEPITINRRPYILTAYANRPPTTHNVQWSWNLRFKRKKEEKYVSLGRLDIQDVPKAMIKAFQKNLPKYFVRAGSSKTVEELLLSWFQAKIQSRAPSSEIREEYKLSRHTVQNTQSAIEKLINIIGHKQAHSLHQGSIDELISALEMRYAPRTKHLYLSIFIRAYNWAMKQNESLSTLHIPNPNPHKKTKYSVNRHTPTEDDVNKLYDQIKGTKSV